MPKVISTKVKKGKRWRKGKVEELKSRRVEKVKRRKALSNEHKVEK